MSSFMSPGTVSSQTHESPSPHRTGPSLRVALLTGGDDRSYALGLAAGLMARCICLDFVGSDNVDGPELHGTPYARFLNLRGEQSPDAGIVRKVVRLATYYTKLIAYAFGSRADVLHILWNNKLLHFDRTLLMLYYRLLGHRVVLTAHNVNAEKRDGRDSALNRLTLRLQYAMCDHLFVHTERMRDELCADFGTARERVTVIPFGINNTCPSTALDGAQARQALGIDANDRVLLFFGQIAPYKGLEHLVAAFAECVKKEPRLRLIIAGKVKAGCEQYWKSICESLRAPALDERVIRRIEHIPDSAVEVYFKAADALVIPYLNIFQSGVPFLAYGFGLPVIATDVGALREDVLEGKTGMLCRPGSARDLANVIDRYFESALYADLESARVRIRHIANERYSWATVAALTEAVYRRVRTPSRSSVRTGSSAQ